MSSYAKKKKKKRKKKEKTKQIACKVTTPITLTKGGTLCIGNIGDYHLHLHKKIMSIYRKMAAKPRKRYHKLIQRNIGNRIYIPPFGPGKRSVGVRQIFSTGTTGKVVLTLAWDHALSLLSLYFMSLTGRGRYFFSARSSALKKKKKKKKKKRLIARYADLYLLIKTLFCKWFTNMSSGLAYDPFSHVPSFTHFIFPC